MPASTSIDFLVGRKSLHETKLVETPLALKEGQALLEVDRFAFTANNITYGAFGDLMNYWGFFPAPEGWGRVPVWGFGDVVESRARGVAVGERVYGYFPMSTHLVVEPGRHSDRGFFDVAAHRRGMPSIYNTYLRAATDPGYDPRREAEQALLRPLFMTSFLLEDMLVESGFFGARDIVLSSASSKTSLGLAFLLRSRRRGQVEVVGLTSAANAAFVEGTSCYDRVIVYDAIASISRDNAAVFVDMAGDAGVRAAVHTHWGDALKYSSMVGATHWDRGRPTGDLPGPTPQLFFAPERLKKRSQEWGYDGMEARVAEAWASFLVSVDGWMKITFGRGVAEVERVYREMLAGKANPAEGHILSLHS